MLGSGRELLFCGGAEIAALPPPRRVLEEIHPFLLSPRDIFWGLSARWEGAPTVVPPPPQSGGVSPDLEEEEKGSGLQCPAAACLPPLLSSSSCPPLTPPHFSLPGVTPPGPIPLVPCLAHTRSAGPARCTQTAGLFLIILPFFFFSLLHLFKFFLIFFPHLPSHSSHPHLLRIAITTPEENRANPKLHPTPTHQPSLASQRKSSPSPGSITGGWGGGGEQPSPRTPALSTMMFRDQVGVLAGWFKGWNECEQTVALLSLLKRVSRTQARFLQLCLEHSLADCTELHVLEGEANNPGEFAATPFISPFSIPFFSFFFSLSFSFPFPPSFLFTFPLCAFPLICPNAAKAIYPYLTLLISPPAPPSLTFSNC